MKRYAQLLILALLLPHCAAQASSMFLPTTAGHLSAAGVVGSDQPCHETGSAADPADSEHPDCCIRPPAGQVENNFDPSLSVTPGLGSLIIGYDRVRVAGGSEDDDSIEKNRRKVDLSGVVMRN